MRRCRFSIQRCREPDAGQRAALKDFYNEHDAPTVTNHGRNQYNETFAGLEDWE